MLLNKYLIGLATENYEIVIITVPTYLIHNIFSAVYFITFIKFVQTSSRNPQSAKRKKEKLERVKIFLFKVGSYFAELKHLANVKNQSIVRQNNDKKTWL